jgi:hypothetical protein
VNGSSFHFSKTVMLKQNQIFIHAGVGFSLLMLSVACSGLTPAQSQPSSASSPASPEITATTEVSPSPTFSVTSTPAFTSEPTQAASSLPTSSSNYFLMSNLTFMDSRHGRVSVRTCEACPASVYETEDGGQTWQLGPDETATPTRQGVLLASASAAETLWAIECLTPDYPCSGTLIVSVNNGQTWQPVPHQPPLPPLWPGSDGPYPFVQLVRINARETWIHMFSPDAADPSTRSQLIATDDGGAHWQTLPDPCPEVVGRLAAWDAVHLWRQCDLGRAPQFMDPMAVYRSVDGGRHWELVAQTDDSNPASLPNGVICDLTFISPERGFMALCNVYEGLLTSDDAGHTWKSIDLKGPNKPTKDCLATQRLSQPTFIDAHHGWVIESFTNSCDSSTRSLLYRTADGGVTWEHVAATFHS